jgi:L-ribulose-5-phosphate 4-epimerase
MVPDGGSDLSPLSLLELREQVWRANQALVGAGLVTLSFGNASGVDRAAGVLVIKPSGVPYDQLLPEHLVAVALEDGRVVEGELRPSSDTPTHLALYRRFPEIGGVVHTHSTAATAWAQAGRSIPPLGTTHADHFHGPCRSRGSMLEAEVGGEYEAETGAVIIETLQRLGLSAAEMPAALVASHGPFTWGRRARRRPTTPPPSRPWRRWRAGPSPSTRTVEPIERYLLERHFRRKHGPDAYYGQRRR